MLSFPSAINQGGISNTLYDDNGHEVYVKEKNQAFFDVSRIKTMNINLNSKIKQELLNDMSLDISMNNYRIKPRKFVNSGATQLQGQADNTDNEFATWTENTSQIPASILSTMNRYTRVYKTPVNNLMNAGSEEPGNDGIEGIEVVGLKTKVVSSIFNPIHMIQVNGLLDNLPLINVPASQGTSYIDLATGDGMKGIMSIYSSYGNSSIHKVDENSTEDKSINAFYESFKAKGDESGLIIGPDKMQVKVNYNPFNEGLIDNSANCTIRELVNRSHTPNGVLGMAKYKYADFLFCKHIGKASNNHLITLRRFAHPVGDNIFRFSGKGYLNEQKPWYHGYQENASIGTLVTWFGTDDNKLEDILNYSVKSSWKEFTAEIREIDSREDDEANGIIGMFANSFNPAYNSLVARGMAGSNSLWGKLGSSLFGGTLRNLPLVNDASQNGVNAHSMMEWELLRPGADHYKIYTPQNTIWETHKYEGRLELSHEFTVNFSYRLRALDVMNPKAVMLDLIGNILEVTYNRGHFWQGENRMIGPPRNSTGIATANAFIDRQWERLEGFMQGFANGTIQWQSMLSTLSDMVSSTVNAVKELADDVINDRAAILNKFASGAKKLAGKFVSSGASRALLGQLKNTLGRPAVYAMNSALSGEPVGLWHITIGNPKNPIAAFGNLIMTNAKITHSGPLGFDDFPTELKVSCTLKHGRSRDLSEVARMYTKGTGAFYNALDKNKLSEFFTVANTVEGQKIESELDTANYVKGIQEQKDCVNAELESIEQQLKDIDTKINQAKEKQKEESAKEEEKKKDAQQSPEKDEKDDGVEGKKQPKKEEQTSTSTDTNNAENELKKLTDEKDGLIGKKKKLLEAQTTADQILNNKEFAKYNENYSIMENQIDRYDYRFRELYMDDIRTEAGRGKDNLLHGHFIQDAWALRYETLGQDLDMEGRILIDENA